MKRPILHLLMLFVTITIWLTAIAPVLHYLAWSDSSAQISSLEAAAQKDEMLQFASTHSAIYQLEREAMAKEKTLTGIACIFLGYLIGVFNKGIAARLGAPERTDE